MQPEVNNSSQTQSNMVSPQKPKRGKKVLAIILVLLLLAGVGAGAWWYGTDQAKKSQAAEVANLQSQIDQLKQDQKKESDENSSSDNTEGFLVIKEWGVKLPLTPELSGVVYSIETIDSRQYVHFSKKAFIEKYGENCSPDQTGQGSLSRGKASDSAGLGGFDGPTFKEYEESVRIGETYYAFVGPQAACGTATTEEGSELTAFAQALRAQVQKLQAAN